MIDHNARIQNKAFEEAEIDRLERSSKPLVIMLIIALLAIFADFMLDIYASQKYASEIKNSNYFVQCLNKNPVQIGDEWAHCRVEKISLVEGIK